MMKYKTKYSPYETHSFKAKNEVDSSTQSGGGRHVVSGESDANSESDDDSDNNVNSKSDADSDKNDDSESDSDSDKNDDSESEYSESSYDD